MYHHEIYPEVGDQGHWAVAPSSNSVDVLVQIGEVMERRQARPLMTVATALHLAADLINAAISVDKPGTTHIGDEDGPWFISCRAGVATITLRDARQPHPAANADATLAMPGDDCHAMGVEIVRVALGLLES